MPTLTSAIHLLLIGVCRLHCLEFHLVFVTMKFSELMFSDCLVEHRLDPTPPLSPEKVDQGENT